MKSNFVPLQVLLVATVIALAACAGKDSNPPASSPVPPGSIEASSAQSTGSFQGPITNNEGEIQAILTLDIFDSSAQLTVTPNGVTEVLPLESGGRSFNANLGQVKVAASWNGSAWVGQVSNTTVTNSFTLKAGASTDAAIAIGAPSGTFDGVLDYKGGRGKHRMSLNLTASKSLADALASTLTSKVNLTGFLADNHGGKEPLKNVMWDRETSTLSADGTKATSVGTTAIRCKMSEMNAGDKDVLQCSLSSTKGSTVAVGSLSQKRAVVAPPYPARPVVPVPTQATPLPTATPLPPVPPVPTATPEPIPVPTASPTATPPPIPTPIAIDKSERVFSGGGVFTNQKGAKQNRSLTLTVTLNSDPSGVDQEAVVKFIIDGSRVGAKFTDAVYNSATGSLRASQMLTLGPIAGALKLQCEGVTLATGRYDYYCHYESSVTNVTGEFHLQGTSK